VGMESAWPSETSTSRRHNLEELNLKLHRPGNVQCLINLPWRSPVYLLLVLQGSRCLL